MPVCVEKKFLFIHVRKVGGYSIAYALEAAGCTMDRLSNKHLYPRDMKREVDGWEDYWKFAFVRNPYDRAVSQYHHELQNLKKVSVRKTGSFGRWLKIRLKEGKIDTMSDILQDEMNFIGRFENFAEDYERVCQHLCIPNKLPEPLNTSKHKYYRDYYSTKLRKLVEQHAAADLKAYNYTF